MCSFKKAQKAVENMCHRQFSKKHLAQIELVMPAAYLLEQSANVCTGGLYIQVRTLPFGN